MLKVFVRYSVHVGLEGFLKPVAYAVDAIHVAWPMLVVLVAHAIHVALPLLVELAVDAFHVALPMLVLLLVDDVLFVILIIPMHLEVLQLLQFPFFFLLAEYLLPLQYVAMFVLELILVEKIRDLPFDVILPTLF